MAVPIPYTGAVEGAVDEAVLRRVAAAAGRELHHVYVTNGRSNLERRVAGFNAAANHAPWIVLIDLDQTACAPELIRNLADPVAPQMRLRVAVTEIEAWLLSDPERLARFLAVARARIPADPDSLPDPKQALVNAARHSRRRSILQDMVPRESSGRAVGVAYEARIIEFVTSESSEAWRPEVAAEGSDSLRRCMAAIA